MAAKLSLLGKSAVRPSLGVGSPVSGGRSRNDHTTPCGRLARASSVGSRLAPVWRKAARRRLLLRPRDAERALSDARRHEPGGAEGQQERLQAWVLLGRSAAAA